MALGEMDKANWDQVIRKNLDLILNMTRPLCEKFSHSAVCASSTSRPTVVRKFESALPHNSMGRLGTPKMAALLLYLWSNNAGLYIRGKQAALDDFGTGHSTLVSLLKMPFGFCISNQDATT